MNSCDMPQAGFDAGVELSCLDTYAFWRFIQTFMLSAQSTITHGLESKPTNKIRADVYMKMRDRTLGYTQRTLYNVFEQGEYVNPWYQYKYAKVCDIFPPADYGRMHYNRLTDGSVDKHQRTYEWNGSKYVADSIFVANLVKPSDVGEISYSPLGGERYVKQSKDYVFTEDEWRAIYSIVQAFNPPADHEAEFCQGFKLFVRKYTFDEITEEYTRHDFDFGLDEGSCGFTGYAFSGTSTAFDFSMDTTDNSVVISNPVLKQHIMDSGVNIITSDMGFSMNPDGSINAFGGMYFSQDEILTFRALNNILTFSMPSVITIGTLAFNPDGTIDGELFANINKSYSINPPAIYTVQDIKIIADGTNTLRIEVNNGTDIESNGTISLTIT